MKLAMIQDCSVSEAAVGNITFADKFVSKFGETLYVVPEKPPAYAPHSIG